MDFETPVKAVGEREGSGCESGRSEEPSQCCESGTVNSDISTCIASRPSAAQEVNCSETLEADLELVVSNAGTPQSESANTAATEDAHPMAKLRMPAYPTSPTSKTYQEATAVMVLRSLGKTLLRLDQMHNNNDKAEESPEPTTRLEHQVAGIMAQLKESLLRAKEQSRAREAALERSRQQALRALEVAKLQSHIIEVEKRRAEAQLAIYVASQEFQLQAEIQLCERQESLESEAREAKAREPKPASNAGLSVAHRHLLCAKVNFGQTVGSLEAPVRSVTDVAAMNKARESKRKSRPEPSSWFSCCSTMEVAPKSGGSAPK